MTNAWKAAVLMAAYVLGAGHAHAQLTTVTGKILATQGHESPSCRRVVFKESGSGTVSAFRIPDAATDNGILAVTLTAVTTGLSVELTFTPSVTTGCGTEPKISFISILAAP